MAMTRERAKEIGRQFYCGDAPAPWVVDAILAACAESTAGLRAALERIGQCDLGCDDCKLLAKQALAGGTPGEEARDG